MNILAQYRFFLEQDQQLLLLQSRDHRPHAVAQGLLND